MKVRFLRGTTEENNTLTLPAGELAVNLDDMSLRIHDGVTQGGFECPSNMAFNLGPGPKQLVAGDYQLGFFGEVTSAELIDGDMLATETGFSAGISQHATTGWLKFAHQGKILYVAKKPLRHTVSWDDIYQAGLVYGTDDTGLTPTGDPTNQISPLMIGQDGFKVRLLTGGDADPASTAGGEWNDLIYRVHVDDPTGSNWASYTDTDIVVGVGDGRTSWAQETDASNADYRVIRGGSSLTRFTAVTSSYASSYYGWRPVLELTSVTKILFPPEDLYYETDYVKASYVYDWSYSDAP